LHYYQFNIGDYRRDTQHLSMLEHGAYRQLLDWFYLDEKPIPKETEVVFRRLSARTEEERSAVLTVLNEMFELTEIGYMKDRCMAQIALYHTRADRARANGMLGGRRKKTEVVNSGNPEKSESQANHKPRTKNQEPLTNNKPKVKNITPSALLASLGIVGQIADDFISLRNRLKAPITKTSIDGIGREAKKAGIPLESALIICCERSWRGFKAEWMKDSKNSEISAPVVTKKTCEICNRPANANTSLGWRCASHLSAKLNEGRE
jgi:uncharacterized protein YdaU (DUF1376 family)